jgi:hypothetical protein
MMNPLGRRQEGETSRLPSNEPGPAPELLWAKKSPLASCIRGQGSQQVSVPSKHITAGQSLVPIAGHEIREFSRAARSAHRERAAGYFG